MENSEKSEKVFTDIGDLKAKGEHPVRFLLSLLIGLFHNVW
jgi:hypothetical protein